MKKYVAGILTKNGRSRGILLCTCLLMLSSGLLTGCGAGESAPNAPDPQEPPVMDEGTAPAGAEQMEEMVEMEDSISMEALEVERIMGEFASAYFAGDVDVITQYLSDSYEGEVLVYEDPDRADEVQIKGIGGTDFGIEGNIGDTYDLTMAFVYPDEDSNTYLTVSFIKEESGWKVTFYGLEK